MSGKTVKVLAMTIGIVGSLWSCSFKEPGEVTDKIDHVIVIGVDGMSPNGIEKASTPMLDNMISKGASTMHARAVLPSSSSPNWASMIMGADTEQRLKDGSILSLIRHRYQRRVQ